MTIGEYELQNYLKELEYPYGFKRFLLSKYTKN